MMDSAMVVEVDDLFRMNIRNRLNRHGRKSRAAKEMNIARTALWQFLNKGTIRISTLEVIVKKFEGEDANVDDYIKKL